MTLPSCQQLLSHIEATASQLTTVGAQFGALVGSRYRLPEKPELWTQSQLLGLRQTHEAAIERSPELARWWERVLEQRAAVFNDYFLFTRCPIPEHVRREALALDPSGMRPLLAQDRDFSHPGLALAGADLFEALCDLVAVSSVELGLSTQRVVACSLSAPNQVMTELQQRGAGHGVQLNGGMVVGQITPLRRCLSIDGGLAGVLETLAGARQISFTASQGDDKLRTFLEAYAQYAREALLANVTIGITTSVGGVTLQSQPLEGLPFEPDIQGKRTLYYLRDGELAGSKALLPGGRTTLPEDASHREALVDTVIKMGASAADCPQIFGLLEWSLSMHRGAVRELVAAPEASLTAAEESELLALATTRHPAIAGHVTHLEEGGYRVTRHDICQPIHLADTLDLVFALRLALAHKVENPMSLNLRAG